MTLIDWLRRRPSIRWMVEDQVKAGEPPEVRATFGRLRALGLSERQVWRLLTLALKAEIMAMRKAGRGFDRTTYAVLLERLPNLPG